MQVATLLARQATVISATPPPATVTTTATPVEAPKKKRGRPSKADIAARQGKE
jgi:hypothetical protein